MKIHLKAQRIDIYPQKPTQNQKLLEKLYKIKQSMDGLLKIKHIFATVCTVLNTIASLTTFSFSN